MKKHLLFPCELTHLLDDHILSDTRWPWKTAETVAEEREKWKFLISYFFHTPKAEMRKSVFLPPIYLFVRNLTVSAVNKIYFFKAKWNEFLRSQQEDDDDWDDEMKIFIKYRRRSLRMNNFNFQHEQRAKNVPVPGRNESRANIEHTRNHRTVNAFSKSMSPSGHTMKGRCTQ